MRVVTAIRTRVREPYELAQGRYSVTASVGIASFPDDATDVAGLLQAADSAMYRSKKRGRDCFAFFRPELDREAGAQQSMKRALVQGLREKSFHLLYQPTFRLQHGARDAAPTLFGAEALIRWRGPAGRLIEPRRFLPVAEETGQIGAVGLWVLEQCCRLLIDMRSELGDAFRLTINLSPRQLREVSFARALERLPSEVVARLDFDLPESALLERSHQVQDSLALLRSLSARLTVEDFGLTNMSWSLLESCQVDRVKLGPHLLHRELGQPRNRALLESAFAVTRAIGAELVAESVESEEQRDLLLELGCTLMQGHLWAPALSAERLLTFAGPVD